MTETVSSWVQALGDRPLPALGQNIKDCHDLLGSASASLNDIGQVINRDPGLACLFFRHINKSRVHSGRPLISTIESSLNLMGMEAIRNLLGQAISLEEQIKEPRVLQAWYRLILRSYHAARLAQDWATSQSDRAPSEVMISTFLMNIGEYCVAITAPDKLITLIRLQAGSLKQSAEQQVLGMLSRDIGLELAEQWGLPELLQDTLKTSMMLGHRVQLCSVPQALAYEADINGWHTEAMQTCYELATGILRLPSAEAIGRIHRRSVEIAREMALPGCRPAAFRLVQLPGAQPQAEPPSPKISPLRAMTASLTAGLKEQAGANELIKRALSSLSDDFGFDRCLLMLPDAEKKRLTIRAAPGFARGSLLKRARPRLDKPGLFSSAMAKPQALWIHDENYPKVSGSLQQEFVALTHSANFMLFSVAIGAKPMALIYTDMSGHPVADGQVKESRGVAALLSKALAQAVKRA